MALGAAGLVYYGVYSALRLPGYHWYYVPPLAALSIFLTIAIGLAARGEHRFVAARALTRPVLVAGAVALVLGRLAVDVDHGIPWRVAAVSTNWATPAEYTRIGADLRRRVGGSAVRGPGEIGTLAYSCRCRIVDEFSDRGRAVRIIDIEIDFGNIARRLLFEANYAWLDRPEPRPASYRLLYAPGRSAADDVWHVSSRWRGHGSFKLVRLPARPRPGG
jgi:hypothetical protein